MTATSSTHQAKVSACKIILQNFDSKQTTVSEMKEYASCVNTIHPSEFSPETVIVLQVIFIVSVLGMIAGGVTAFKDGGGFIEIFLCSLASFLMAALVAGITYGIGYFGVALFA